MKAPRKTALAIARAALPAGARTPAADERTIDALERFLAQAPAPARRLIVLMIWFLEYAAVIACGARLSRLSQERAGRFLQAWAHSDLAFARLAFRAVIAPLKMVHYADPAVARAVGYDPPPETADSQPPSRFAPIRRSQETKLRCEVAVIGSGAGGAVVAKELAERGRNVVLIEEGEVQKREQFNRRPLDMIALMYRDLGLSLALGTAGIPVPTGRTVGGTTTINSGTCFRVPDHVLQSWSGLPVTSAELAPLFDRVEQFIDVQEVPEEVLGNSARLVRQGAAALGLHGKPLRRNARNCKGSGVCCFGCPTGAKRSANLTWVPAALHAGARLLTGARVDRIAASGKRRTVQIADGREVEADAVVVAAGTLQSPQLLWRSGLRHGELGRNISIHPACKAGAVFAQEVRGWEGVPQGFGIHDLHGEGILFEGIFTPPELGAITVPFIGQELVQAMEEYANVASFGFLIEDRSLGHLSLRTGQLFYELGKPEIEKLRRGVDLLAQIFFAAGAREVFAPVHSFERLRGLSDLQRLRTSRLRAADFELSAFHPLGSVRASRDPAHGVVDDQLEAHDLERLFVVDGSVFPSSLGVNPQLTIMAFAQRASSHIDARLGGLKRN